MTQSTFVETCHHNLQIALLTQIGVAECRTWKQLVLQDEQARRSSRRPKLKKRRVSLDRKN